MEIGKRHKSGADGSGSQEPMEASLSVPSTAPPGTGPKGELTVAGESSGRSPG